MLINAIDHHYLEMPTLKTTDYNREGTKRVSTVRNIVCLHQLNQEVSHVLEECVVVTSKIDNPIICQDFIKLLDKLKSINDMIITIFCQMLYSKMIIVKIIWYCRTK